MKYISEENLRKWILTDNCNDGCGYIDERDLVDMEWEEDNVKVLDKIKTEILLRDKSVKDIRTDGRCFFTADEILEIIDKYRKEVNHEADN